jgi:hypothetical protein
MFKDLIFSLLTDLLLKGVDFEYSLNLLYILVAG